VPEAAILSSAFEALREGDTFATRGRTVTEADVVSFAALTGLHSHQVDAVPSATTGHEAQAAPGLLTLSYGFGLVRADPDRVIGIRSLTDVVFTRPVTIGDTIASSGRITSLAPASGDTGVVGMTLLTSNQDGKTVCRARVEMLWRRDLSTDRATEGADG
jgi:3-hydroxybutyryl-CoA dehydratase